MLQVRVCEGFQLLNTILTHSLLIAGLSQVMGEQPLLGAWENIVFCLEVVQVSVARACPCPPLSSLDSIAVPPRGKAWKISDH